MASNLAVTAVFASWLMHVVLGWREWAAVCAVVIGVGFLGSSAGAEGAATVGVSFHLALIVALAVIAVGGIVRGEAAEPDQDPGARRHSLSGLGFGVVAVCARILPGFAPHQLVRSPAAYTLVAAGVIAFVLYASALESGSVTVATAAVILVETIPPAIVGVLLLGDTTRPGRTGLAIAGFVLALVSAIALARFGEAGSHDDGAQASGGRLRPDYRGQEDPPGRPDRLAGQAIGGRQLPDESRNG